MIQPIDVALDDRLASPYVYVADQENKTILRFFIANQGNVSPNKEVLLRHTPVALSLDARGGPTP